MQPDSPSTLYWSIRGEVSCANHAPHHQSERWKFECWAKIPQSSVINPRGQACYQCQFCAEDGRALIRYAESAAHIH